MEWRGSLEEFQRNTKATKALKKVEKQKGICVQPGCRRKRSRNLNSRSYAHKHCTTCRGRIQAYGSVESFLEQYKKPSSDEALVSLYKQYGNATKVNQLTGAGYRRIRAVVQILEPELWFGRFPKTKKRYTYSKKVRKSRRLNIEKRSVQLKARRLEATPKIVQLMKKGLTKEEIALQLGRCLPWVLKCVREFSPQHLEHLKYLNRKPNTWAKENWKKGEKAMRKGNVRYFRERRVKHSQALRACKRKGMSFFSSCKAIGVSWTPRMRDLWDNFPD